MIAQYGRMLQWYDAMEQWQNGTISQWYDDSIVQWPNGDNNTDEDRDKDDNDDLVF